MSNFTSLLFHRSTLSLVRAHMAEVPGGVPRGVWGGSGTPKNPKKVKKVSKNRFFWHFFWFLAVLAGTSGKYGKNGQKWSKKGSKTSKNTPKTGVFTVFRKNVKKNLGSIWDFLTPKTLKNHFFYRFFGFFDIFLTFFDIFWHFLTFFDKFVKNLWIFLFVFSSVELKSFLIHFDSRLKWIKKWSNLGSNLGSFWDPKNAFLGPLGTRKTHFKDPKTRGLDFYIWTWAGPILT